MSFSMIPDFLSHFASSTWTAEARPGLKPIPGTRPLTIEAAICPPLLYYVALLFLAPSPPPQLELPAVKLLRNVLAILAGFLFFRLPLAYHVPQSIGLTYQLGLVGIYGGCRVIDAFFISLYGFGHVPKRVSYLHKLRPATPEPTERSPEREKQWTDGGVDGAGRSREKTDYLTVKKASQNGRRPSLATRISASDLSENMTSESYSEILSKFITGPDPIPVTETAVTESGFPTTFADRASWALELEMSMRGVGFTWTTADVRHTRKTWLPTVANRVHSIAFHVGPVLLVCWAVIKYAYVTHILPAERTSTSPFDEQLNLPQQLLLTAALGAFLMAAFSLGHSVFAIMLSPLAPSPLAFFPPLYTTPVWQIQSARGFWSFGWHRLFARLFLVYGVWPGQWLERKLLRKTNDQPADVGKVLGGFISSAFVHSFSVRCVLGGDWREASGEALFFALNGVAIVVEGIFQRLIKSHRKKHHLPAEMWYDAWIGRMWWISVLLFSGRNFARGWTKSGLVREMAFM